MRPLGIVGIVLIALGAIVLILGGISYVRDRSEVQVGPIEVAAEERGFISPIYGAIAIVAGAVLLVAGRRRA